MEKNKLKKIAKIAAILYIASFLLINWNDVSWIFNYKAVSGIIEDFFNPYPTITASNINPYFYPNHSQQVITANSTIISDQPVTSIQSSPGEIKTSYTEKQNTLEIPKLSLSVPIVFSKNADMTTLMKDLDSGVVYYPGSVYPGQVGQAIILGHSAPPGWPNIKHDWVFTNIEKLSEGDIILIDLNNKQYKYIVKQKTIIKRGADIPSDDSATRKNVLTLISCWPPGKDYQRITVTAELVDN